MTTNIVGIKEFRQNITSLWKKARRHKTRYIIMHHSTPIFEVTPLAGKRLVLDRLARDVAEARRQVKRGDVYTSAEVYQELGL